MSTYEARVEVTFMLDAESEEDARTQVEETLMNVAYDWGNVVVE
jgi:hypothetical protein